VLIEVKNIIVKDIITVRGNRTVASARSLMNYFNLDALIVTDEDEPVGIITLSDVKRRVLDKQLDPHVTLIEEIFSKPLIWVKYNTTLPEVAELMEEHQVKRLPIFGNLSNGPILLGAYVYKPDNKLIEV
jgi:CBS domain-containing protein